MEELEKNEKKYKEDTKVVNPFERRDSLQRTPPGMRAYSLPDLETNGEGVFTNTEKANKQKRKRAELSPEDQAETNTGIRLRHILETISNQAKILEKLIKESYKPKKEYTDISSKLTYQITLLQSTEMVTWLQNSIEYTCEKDIQHELKVENNELRNEIRNLESKLGDAKKERNEADLTKCEACENLQRLNIKRIQLKQNETYERFQEIPEDDWVNGTFPELEVKIGSIWEASMDHQIALPCSENLESKDKHVNRAIGKFGGKEGLIRQNKREGEIARMIQSHAFPETDGAYTTYSRTIHYLIIPDQLQGGKEAECAFNALKLIRADLLNNGVRKLAIPEMDGDIGSKVIKMIKFIFCDSGVEVSLYRPFEQTRRTRLNTEGGMPRVQNNKQDAILMKMKDKTYADLLKMVKNSVNPSELGVDIGDVKKTRDGNLLLTIQNGSDRAEIFKKELSEKLPGITVSTRTKKKVIHIKGMDELATEREIRDSVAKVTSLRPETIDVRALRPAFGNHQNATIIVEEKAAEELIRLGKIKIGWLNCKLIERKREEKCTRCWDIGHHKSNCKGPNREHLCLKCGKPDHKAAECKNEPYCLQCKEAGHQTGSRRCGKILRGVSRTAADQEM